jgi:hypothetical protein
MGEQATEMVRIGIVGAGNRGRNHANRYDRIPGAEVVAVADVDESKARALADDHGIESYSDHETMLAEADFDAANVCVHATLHAGITVDALESGVDVFCEKPMAGCYAEARRMYEAAERTGQRLAVQNQLLYTAETRAARAIADAGELGEVYHGIAARSPGLAFASGSGTGPKEVQVGVRRRGTPTWTATGPRRSSARSRLAGAWSTTSGATPSVNYSTSLGRPLMGRPVRSRPSRGRRLGRIRPPWTCPRSSACGG